MNTPPTVPATANSILVQHRIRPMPDHVSDEDHYTIPPMSIVFETEGTKGDVRNVAAHADCWGGGAPEKRKFRGVSVHAVDGPAAKKWKESRNRLAIITRGEATIMVPYDDVRQLQLGQWVKIKQDKGAAIFADYRNTPTFSIEPCANNKDADAIGYLIRKPNRRQAENWATVVLF